MMSGVGRRPGRWRRHPGVCCQGGPSCSSLPRGLEGAELWRFSVCSLLQAVTVYECLSEWGQILCAICPNPRLVVTGGTSTVVCVWEMGTSKEKAKSLTLKQV